MNKIIKFEASWCQPCHRLTNELKDIEFDIDRVDIEEQPDKIDAHNVKGVPTLIFLKGGVEVNRVVGFTTKEKVKSLIEEIYGSELSH